MRAIGEVGGAGAKSVAWDGQGVCGGGGGEGKGPCTKAPRADKNGSSLTPPRCCWGRRINTMKQWYKISLTYTENVTH